MTRRLLERVLVAAYLALGPIARLLRLRTPPGRWRPSSNRHRYLESA
ncbi:hypothetical protein SK803_28315 [Lentzea sp. BCCO 10_0856]|uniref:Uncharacterized protein n=1 Tax=Lentzea miocenica TaxID=3095431 RepID=A0ABU4T7J6_9PSEU|nr:hypothetical protein [Lentzea sp. BCCO 10_0856]MDX8034141.1 hypothetical protein [Lentzea sp. BCCO 10_0856]